MQRRLILTAGAALTLTPFLAPRASAQQSEQSGKVAILQAGAYSMLLSAAALERSASARVEEFASLEVEEQRALAAAFGMGDVPPEITPLQSDGLEAFLSGDESAFEATYIEEQLLGHKALLPLMEDYAARGEDPMARGAAMLAVPSIKSHVVMLTDIKGGMA